MKKAIIWIVLIAFSGTIGCATMTEQEKTRAEGAGIGAAAGAFGGALLGAIFGGKRGAAVGAMAGAALGVTAGALYGDHVANQKGKYSSEEAYLNACVASVRQVTDDTLAYQDTLRRDVDILSSEAETDLEAYRQNRIQANDLYDTRARVETRLAEATAKLEAARTESKIQRETVQRERQVMTISLDPLESEITRLDAAAAELEGLIQTLQTMKRKLTP